MYVCLCKGVTDSQIREAISEGASSMRAIREQTGVMSACGKCACHTHELFKANSRKTEDSNPLWSAA